MTLGGAFGDLCAPGVSGWGLTAQAGGAAGRQRRFGLGGGACRATSFKGRLSLGERMGTKVGALGMALKACVVGLG